MQFPVVDYRSTRAAEDFCTSLAQTGFGVLANHPLEASLVEGIYAEWQEFFASDAKHRVAFDPVPETAKGHTQRDLKEFFHIFPWGRYPAEVSDAARRYYLAGSRLAGELLGWVEAHSPPEVRARYSQPLPSMIEACEDTLLPLFLHPRREIVLSDRYTVGSYFEERMRELKLNN
jgi:hypothetical protein